MEQKPKKSKRKIGMIIGIVVLAIIGLLLAAVLIYTGIYYRADQEAVTAALSQGVVVTQGKNYTSLALPGEEPETGYIFYPGGKVEETAYLPYLAGVAEEGYFCALIKSPFRLAILDIGAANRVMEDHPEIENWVVGGHSLGGVAAVEFTPKGNEVVEGLVLLASYPNSDISARDVQVLSITADQDKVLNWEAFENAKGMLPPNTRFITIAGGNHSGFGAYGQQKGDGVPLLIQEEQRAEVVEATADFLGDFAAA